MKKRNKEQRTHDIYIYITAVWTTVEPTESRLQCGEVPSLILVIIFQRIRKRLKPALVFTTVVLPSTSVRTQEDSDSAAKKCEDVAIGVRSRTSLTQAQALPCAQLVVCNRQRCAMEKQHARNFFSSSFAIPTTNACAMRVATSNSESGWTTILSIPPPPGVGEDPAYIKHGRNYKNATDCHLPSPLDHLQCTATATMRYRKD